MRAISRRTSEQRFLSLHYLPERGSAASRRFSIALAYHGTDCLPLLEHWKSACAEARRAVAEGRCVAADLPDALPVIIVPEETVRGRIEGVRRAREQSAERRRKGLHGLGYEIADLEAEAGMLVTDACDAAGPVYGLTRVRVGGEKRLRAALVQDA